MVNFSELRISDLHKESEFYYADRNKREPVKCKVLDTSLGYPCEIIAEREDTKETIFCYLGFGCYRLDEYEKAMKDAQIQEDRIIY